MAGKGEVMVRFAEEKDLDAIVDIWWQLVVEHEDRDRAFWGLLPEHVAKERFREWRQKTMENPDCIHLVAELDGQVIGFVQGQPLSRPPIYEIGRVGRINELAVDSGHRRRGAGRSLLLFITDELASRGYEIVDLMVDADNQAARDMYQAEGFYPRELHMLRRV